MNRILYLCNALRAALSITFLLTYLSICTGPIFPFLEYWLDYDIIVAEKCENVRQPAMECNGKCYLTKELAKATDYNDAQDESSQETDVRPIEVHDQSAFDWVWQFIQNTFSETNFDYSEYFPCGLLNEAFQPPEM